MTSTDDLSSQGPDYRPAALSKLDESRLNYLKERQGSCQTYNSEMAKWILASLFLLNAGPFAALTKENSAYNTALAENAQYFVAALALALTCGFMAWLNTGTREAAIGYEVQQMFAPNQAIVSENEKRKNLSLTVVRVAFAAAVVTGFGSLASFSLGAFHLANALQ